MTQSEVFEAAGNVNNKSLDFHLSHAVLACDKLLEETYKKTGKEERNRINNELQKAVLEKNEEGIQRLLKQKRNLKLPKYRIFVDYVDMEDIEAGRVVRAEDKLIISLPKKLADESRESGGFKKTGVTKLRKVMAHELGHIVLHTDRLLTIDDLNGSKNLDGTQEQEASWFADELLRLRHERNEKLKDVV